MLPRHLSFACANGGTPRSQRSTSQSQGGSQAQLAVGGEMGSAGEQLSVSSQCSIGAAMAERTRSPCSPCPDRRDPQARQDTGTPPASQGMVGATGSSQAPTRPQVPTPCSRLGQGRGCQRCSPRWDGVSSCPRTPAAPGIVGNYGTAVKYKLGKKPLVEARAVCE